MPTKCVFLVLVLVLGCAAGEQGAPNAGSAPADIRLESSDPLPEALPRFTYESPDPLPETLPELPTWYEIKRNDTLYRLSRRFYGEGRHFRAIRAANPDLVPSRMKVGQKILIPKLEEGVHVSPPRSRSPRLRPFPLGDPNFDLLF